MRATILMTARNAAPWISETIDSILKQTEPDFELIVVDDASEDQTAEIVDSYKEGRIKLIRNEWQQGIALSANVGLAQVHTPYIFRMDSDDLCHPDRLRLQLKFMEAHPEIGVCGSYIEFFGKRKGVWKQPITDAGIKAHLVWANALANPAAVIRTSVLRENRLSYTSNFTEPPFEDYELWVKMIPLTKMANLPHVLVSKREHEGNASEVHKAKTQKQLSRFFQWFFAEYDVVLTEEEKRLHSLLHTEEKIKSTELHLFIELQERLIHHFSRLPFFDEQAMRERAFYNWRRLLWHLPLSLYNLLEYHRTAVKYRYPLAKKTLGARLWTALSKAV